MSRIESEQRTLRTGLSTFLSSAGWTGLTFSEGWDAMDIENPLVNVLVNDLHKENLEMGRTVANHKLYQRVAQIDVFMESESRVKAVCEDVMDFLDATTSTITDNFTTSGIGYLIFPDSETISSRFIAPDFNNPEILRWRGVVQGRFEAYYPNGGNPL